MLIALLVVLGIDLIVIVAVLAVVLVRRLWVSRQPGAFHITPRPKIPADTAKATM